MESDQFGLQGCCGCGSILTAGAGLPAPGNEAEIFTWTLFCLGLCPAAADSQCQACHPMLCCPSFPDKDRVKNPADAMRYDKTCGCCDGALSRHDALKQARAARDAAATATFFEATYQAGSWEEYAGRVVPPSTPVTAAGALKGAMKGIKAFKAAAF